MENLSQLEIISERLANIDKTLAVNTKELQYHIEQTLILRSEVKVNRSELNILKADYQRIKGFFMYMGIILSVAAGATTIIYNMIRLFKGLQ